MKRKFVFLIHPRTIDDFYRRLGNMLGLREAAGMKFLPYLFPKPVAKWVLKRLRGRAGFTICSHFRAGEEVEGYIIAILLTGDQMINLPHAFVRDRIIDAIIYARDVLGVERVGLGAYTAPMTLGGYEVFRDKRFHFNKSKKSCRITHGDSLTSVAAVEALKKGLTLKGRIFGDSIVGIVGAYGVVGRAAAILTSELGPKKLILTGPNVRKLQEVRNEIAKTFQGEILTSQDNSTVSEADALILATSAPTDIISASMLKENAVVVDMSQPVNMSKSVCEQRLDVLRIDGGFMHVPGVNLGFEMGPPAETTFACLTETMVSTIVGDQDNHIGQVDVNFAKRIFTEGQERGFVLAPLTNFSESIEKGGKKL